MEKKNYELEWRKFGWKSDSREIISTITRTCGYSTKILFKCFLSELSYVFNRSTPIH